MELRHLRYFVAVASHGSFNRAARVLHLTQPPLSRQVQDLEDELGVRLFERGPNSVKMTEAGEIFYEEARDVLARADQAVRRIMPRTLVAKLFAPLLPSASVMIGLPSLRPNPHAEAFARMLLDEAQQPGK